MHPIDSDLQRRVTTALACVSDLDIARIGVTVHNGAVTLTGEVGEPRQRNAALRAVRSVSGIVSITLHLDVRPQERLPTADEELAARIVRMIAWELGLPAGTIQVGVEQGDVVLEGRVESDYERRRIDLGVRRLQGVCKLVNRLGLVDRWWYRAAPAPRTPSIQVRANGDGTVVLEGLVHDEQARLDAEAALRGAPGVLDVDNRLIVEPLAC